MWRQGCGSPETGPDATASGNLVRIDCRTGESAAPPDGFARPLSRAYLRAVPGRLESLSTGPLSITGTAPADPVNCAIDVWIPGDVQPRLTATGVTGLAYEKVSGGWSVSGCARGAYTITETG